MALLDNIEQRIVAVEHTVHNPWPKRIALTVLVLVLSALGFFVALSRTDMWYADLEKDNARLNSELVEQQSQNELLLRDLATLTAGAKVDRQAAESVRVELRNYLKEIATLNESVQFYENLMNPKAGQAGLDAYDFVVYRSADTDVYRFRLVLQQLGNSQKPIDVGLTVRIVGVLNGEPVSFDLAELYEGDDLWPSKLSFKYYYNAEGKLRLPDNFLPEKVLVELTQLRKKVKPFEFNWQVTEN